MTVDDVAAVIVTRGNVNINRILEHLPYPEVIVWNDKERGCQGCYGRYLAAAEADRDVIYFQDDDLIFRAHDELVAAFDPERMVVNMPSPWYERTGYDALRQGMVGAGSVMRKGIWEPAVDEYLARYPADWLFLERCDNVIGLLTPYTRLDLGYEILDYASGEGRIATVEGAQDRKFEIQRRALEIRDAR